MSHALHPAVSAHLDGLERFLRIDRQRGVRTIATYLEHLEEFARYLAPALGPVSIGDVSRHDCLSFLRSPSSQGGGGDVSPSVWNMRLRALKALFSYVLEEEVVDRNPTDRIRYRNVNSLEKVPLTLATFLDVVDAAERSRRSVRTRNVAIVQTFFNTALRVSELASLSEAQINWQRHVFVSVRMKGGKREDVHFPDIVAEALEQYLADPARRRSEEGALFTTWAGTRLTVRAIQQLVKSLGAKAGATTQVTPHILRHSCATTLKNELDTDMETVAHVLHHEHVATTKTYVHATRGADRAAIDALGARVLRAMRDRRRAHVRRRAAA